jgi:hypothetical protein
LFSKLAKCEDGSSEDIGSLISEKLKDGLNGDMKSISKLRYPSNERCCDDIWLELTLLRELAKYRGSSRLNIAIIISEKLEDGLNGDVKPVTKLCYPSK